MGVWLQSRECPETVRLSILVPSDGGIWKTTDAGVTWEPIFDGQPIASIGALVVAPSNPNVMYAGTGESDIRTDLSSGDGVYKSLDGGDDLEKYRSARFPTDQSHRG